MKAHKLLESAYKLDQQNARILYDLGCDYYFGFDKNRGVKRDVDKAEILFNEAMRCAMVSNDIPLQGRIKKMLSNYKEDE